MPASRRGGANQIIVGYTAQQEDNYLAVYAYQKGKLEAIFAEPYDQYIVEDITGTGYEDLICWAPTRKAPPRSSC